MATQRKIYYLRGAVDMQILRWKPERLSRLILTLTKGQFRGSGTMCRVEGLSGNMIIDSNNCLEQYVTLVFFQLSKSRVALVDLHVKELPNNLP